MFTWFVWLQFSSVVHDKSNQGSKEDKGNHAHDCCDNHSSRTVLIGCKLIDDTYAYVYYLFN